MATPEQAKNTALKLIGQAADLLESVDDRVGATRARHTLAIIQHDDRFPNPREDLRVPLSLMRMALALMDRDGNGSTSAACSLQHAIDHARGAKPGDAPDPAMLTVFETHGFNQHHA